MNNSNHLQNTSNSHTNNPKIIQLNAEKYKRMFNVYFVNLNDKEREYLTHNQTFKWGTRTATISKYVAKDHSCKELKRIVYCTKCHALDHRTNQCTDGRNQVNRQKMAIRKSHPHLSNSKLNLLYQKQVYQKRCAACPDTVPLHVAWSHHISDCQHNPISHNYVANKHHPGQIYCLNCKTWGDHFACLSAEKCMKVQEAVDLVLSRQLKKRFTNNKHGVNKASSIHLDTNDNELEDYDDISDVKGVPYGTSVSQIDDENDSKLDELQDDESVLHGLKTLHNMQHEHKKPKQPQVNPSSNTDGSKVSLPHTCADDSNNNSNNISSALKKSTRILGKRKHDTLLTANDDSAIDSPDAKKQCIINANKFHPHPSIPTNLQGTNSSDILASNTRNNKSSTNTASTIAATNQNEQLHQHNEQSQLKERDRPTNRREHTPREKSQSRDRSRSRSRSRSHSRKPSPITTPSRTNIILTATVDTTSTTNLVVQNIDSMINDIDFNLNNNDNINTVANNTVLKVDAANVDPGPTVPSNDSMVVVTAADDTQTKTAELHGLAADPINSSNTNTSAPAAPVSQDAITGQYDALAVDASSVIVPSTTKSTSATPNVTVVDTSKTSSTINSSSSL